ncbi:RidA family protein [Pelagibacterium montanilacus]|uniref:RidA family protein n=1 Tax=Pelagibacterium montanilacus TaxID=2185280 RepID=UPI0013E02C08|nr:Rid family hydrolase [Pelagibacterium montanilacus]
MRTIVSSPDAAPPVGPYSQGVILDNTLYVAGQGPFDDKGDRVGDTFADQVHRAFDNLEAVARAAGTGFEHMAKLGVFLANMDDFPVFNRIAGERLVAPYPVRVTVPASLRGFDIELDGIFYVPR